MYSIIPLAKKDLRNAITEERYGRGLSAKMQVICNAVNPRSLRGIENLNS